MSKKKKVTYQKHTNTYYLRQAIKSLLNLGLIKDMIYRFAYNTVNHTIGKQAASIGNNTKIHPTAFIRHGERVIMGEHCFINHNNVIQGGKNEAKVILGNHVQTGPGVMMFAFNHGTELNGIPMIDQDYFEADIVIEDDVWIGAGSIITAGVHIGKGCVIGSNSVGPRDLPENMVCVGGPCKPIKLRD